MAEVKDPEIPFSFCTFMTEDPDHPSLTEFDDIKSMTLGVKKLKIPLFPNNEFMALRFSDLEKTPDGKSTGIIFFLDHRRALDHLITELMEVRNQLYGININSQN